MDYVKLKAELAKPAYADLSDAEAASLLNAVNIAMQGSVSIPQIIRWAAATDAIYRLKQASASGQRDVRAKADTALMMLVHPHITELDVTDPELGGLMAALVASMVFTQAEMNELVARGLRTVSQAEGLGLPHVDVGNIMSARS